MNTEKTVTTASAPETRTYATHNGERVEVIGEDSSDKTRALILSGRGFTSYLPKSELQTASARPENVPVSWELWHSMLTPEQEHQAALETGFARFGGGYDETKAQRFEALVEFRRSMKLFHHYATQVNP